MLFFLSHLESLRSKRIYWFEKKRDILVFFHKLCRSVEDLESIPEHILLCILILISSSVAAHTSEWSAYYRIGMNKSVYWSSVLAIPYVIFLSHVESLLSKHIYCPPSQACKERKMNFIVSKTEYTAWQTLSSRQFKIFIFLKIDLSHSYCMHIRLWLPT
jgi:hypothetical protein